MSENETGRCGCAKEQFSERVLPADTGGDNASWDACRRIERLCELRHLRALLDDPDFDDLD